MLPLLNCFQIWWKYDIQGEMNEYVLEYIRISERIIFVSVVGTSFLENKKDNVVDKMIAKLTELYMAAKRNRYGFHSILSETQLPNRQKNTNLHLQGKRLLERFWLVTNYLSS